MHSVVIIFKEHYALVDMHWCLLFHSCLFDGCAQCFSFGDIVVNGRKDNLNAHENGPVFFYHIKKTRIKYSARWFCTI